MVAIYASYDILSVQVKTVNNIGHRSTQTQLVRLLNIAYRELDLARESKIVFSQEKRISPDRMLRELRTQENRILQENDTEICQEFKESLRG